MAAVPAAGPIFNVPEKVFRCVAVDADEAEFGVKVEAEDDVLVTLAKPPATPSEFGPPITALEPAAEDCAPEPEFAHAPPTQAKEMIEAKSNFFMMEPLRKVLRRPLRFNG